MYIYSIQNGAGNILVNHKKFLSEFQLVTKTLDLYKTSKVKYN